MPYKLHSIRIHADASASAVDIGDLVSKSVDINPEFLVDKNGGDQYPSHVAFNSASPDLSFETYDIVSLLDEVGVAGLCVESDTNPGIEVYLQKIDNCGKQASGSVHRKLTFGAGLLVVDSVSCGHRENARASARLYSAADGANAAVVIDDSAALPSSVNTRNRWTLGDQSIGGNSLSDFVDLSVNLGQSVSKRGVQSQFENTYIEQFETSPEVELRGISPAWFASGVVPYAGLALAHADTSFYLRKRSTDGVGFVSTATAEHIKFTLAGIAAVMQTASASENNFSETSVRCVGQVDGSANAPLIYDGASTHP